MPIYEFECTCCPSRFELKRSFHDDRPVFCPSCGTRARRLFSSVPIIFKGSGFYVTDSRGGQGFTSAPGDSDESAPVTEEFGKAASEESRSAAMQSKAGKSEDKVAAGKEKS